jgi:dienelactone hydrolase
MAEQRCCPTDVLPLKGDLNYQARGETIEIAGQQVYLSGSGDKAIIVAPDIFGWHPNVFQVCDKLAQSGFFVILPDFFRGEAFDITKLSGQNPGEEIRNWINMKGNWEIVKRDIDNVIPVIQQRGVKTLGFAGFCWGAKQAMRCAVDDRFSAVAGVHPSFVNAEDAQNAKVPVCLLPSKDEPPMDDVKAVLDTKPWADKVIWKRFDNMHHGFCAARGDWTVPEQAAAAAEALQLLVTFFTATL